VFDPLRQAYWSSLIYRNIKEYSCGRNRSEDVLKIFFGGRRKYSCCTSTRPPLNRVNGRTIYTPHPHELNIRNQHNQHSKQGYLCGETKQEHRGQHLIMQVQSLPSKENNQGQSVPLSGKAHPRHITKCLRETTGFARFSGRAHATAAPHLPGTCRRGFGSEAADTPDRE
jgi:hypothetical protein